MYKIRACEKTYINHIFKKIDKPGEKQAKIDHFGVSKLMESINTQNSYNSSLIGNKLWDMRWNIVYEVSLPFHLNY